MWLKRVIRGVYRRPLPEGAQGADETSWEISLLSLQWIMKYAVPLGGESALDMAGYAHYLSLGGRSRVQFYGEVPSWLKRLPMQTEIVMRRRTLFGDDPVGIDEAGLETESIGASVEVWRWPIKVSSPERAILEALNELPHRASFENLDKIFEGLPAPIRKYRNPSGVKLSFSSTACSSSTFYKTLLRLLPRTSQPGAGAAITWCLRVPTDDHAGRHKCLNRKARTSTGQVGP